MIILFGMTNAVRRSSPRLIMAPAPRRSPTPLGVVAQVRLAFRPKARLATVLGALLGGFVPLASYTVAHQEANFDTLRGWIAVGLVLGGLVFSAKTVREWGELAFHDGRKALGFVVLMRESPPSARRRGWPWRRSRTSSGSTRSPPVVPCHVSPSLPLSHHSPPE